MGNALCANFQCATLREMKLRMQVTIVALAWAIPLLCAAADIPVSLANARNDLLQRISASPSHAEVQLAGGGDRIDVRYRSDTPVEAFVFFGDAKAPLDITTALAATLPAGNDADASLDVSASPAWSLFTNNYQVFFLVHDAQGTSIQTVSLIPTPLWRVPAIALRQFFTPEPYQPSSYHRLKGYQIFGLPLTILSLIACAVCIGIIVIWKRRGARLMPVLTALLVTFLLYGARFSSDLLWITTGHLQEWYGHETYAQAGSAYAIADAITKDGNAHPSKEKSTVLLCTQGTSFVPALMTYLLYPIPVTQLAENANESEYVIVFQPPMAQGQATRDEGAHAESVRCDGLMVAGLTRLQSFPDGSILYASR